MPGNLGNTTIPSATKVFSVTVPIAQNKIYADSAIIQQNPSTVILLNPPTNIQLKKRLQPPSECSGSNQRVKKINTSNSVNKCASFQEPYQPKNILKNRRLSIDVDNVSVLQINEKNVNTDALCDNVTSIVSEENIQQNLQGSVVVSDALSNDTNLHDGASVNKPVATQVIQLNPNVLHRGNTSLRLPTDSELPDASTVQPTAVTTTYT